MKTLGLVGNGKWGSNYIHIASQLKEPVKIIVGNRLDWYELIHSKKCDGIIIATPPDSHIKIAREALKANLPVMIEKPLALSLHDALILKEYESNAPILVNHLHLFSPAFEGMCRIIDPLDIIEIRSTGVNVGPFRNYSSLFDYGPHDLSMGMYLTKSNSPEIEMSIRSAPASSYPSANTFELKLIYLKDIYHRITVGNAGPQKTRNFYVTTKKDVYLYDDVSEEKLFINNKPQEISKISTLENSLEHFIKSIDGYTDNRFGLDLSINIVSILQNCCQYLNC